MYHIKNTYSVLWVFYCNLNDSASNILHSSIFITFFVKVCYFIAQTVPQSKLNNIKEQLLISL